MEKLATALYDNTAECADELAFKKGDIITVMDENVAGTSGWWMCSLHGRQGLAPANRLKLLPASRASAGSSNHCVEKRTAVQANSHIRAHGIYQIPNGSRPVTDPAYEIMDMIYNIPSGPLSTSQSLTILTHSTDDPEDKKVSVFNMSSTSKGEVYDVPVQARQALLTESTAPGQMLLKKTHIPPSSLDRRINSPENTSGSSRDFFDPNYDFPVPSATECHERIVGEYRTLPNPRKPEWIYDVPVGSGKLSPIQGIYDTLPSKSTHRLIYDTPPSSAGSVQTRNDPGSLYDIPKSDPLDISSPEKGLQQVPPDDKPPTQAPTESVKEDPLSRAGTDSGDQNPLVSRADLSTELKRVRLQRMRNFLACTTFCDLPGGKEAAVQEEKQSRHSDSADSQRISTASSSSSSSCDSFALSSSPEPPREVTLSHNEACRRVLDLQESVCRTVPQLMDFVSSNWRCKEHLEHHLTEIKEAVERIVCSLTGFIHFAQDIKGNALSLTDANLQTRLYKQLTVIEDSSVILQQTASKLNTAGWSLRTICQDPGQVQTPDQLDRFVLVARTVPDDVKHLVSIICANSKLLFKTPPKDSDSVTNTSPPETKKSLLKTEGQAVEDNDDYVELQTNAEETTMERKEKTPVKSVSPVSTTVEKQSESSSSTEQQPSPRSEHCRLYFGALQKAIGGFVDSVSLGQPPEKFIPQSKLVIMVGQRLVDTLYKEAHHRGSCQILLCKSNHLCALLKQLAVATKKAALHFPDRQVLLEAQDFAKILAQKAQHFRTSLDL
ncbi:cas scaffolding protein family member 4 [Austrofundulus limnaeus]|uniref:Cas scaffolding protein family member 4 n=1 Tax=Austrofundulus limnaeus TaxID=52670 RepID=A0A2I4CAZ0_AUSLI|nr:PREDICTED: cas scaffolding protein family member 4 [Austrofundulus limnaeus]